MCPIIVPSDVSQFPVLVIVSRWSSVNINCAKSRKMSKKSDLLTICQVSLSRYYELQLTHFEQISPSDTLAWHIWVKETMILFLDKSSDVAAALFLATN